MWRYLLRRLLLTIPIVVIVPFIIFVLLDLAPGDAASTVAGDGATPQQVAQVRHDLHLGDPLLVRFGRWAGDAVQGRLGTSFETHEQVTTMIRQALPATLSLVLVSLLLTLVIGVGAGIWAGYHPEGVVDRVLIILSSLSIAIPGFWLGLMLVLVFSINLGWLPALGYVPLGSDPWEWLKHLVLPSIALATLPAAAVCLQTRAALADELNKDYVLSAIARGLSRPSVVLRHALKNAGVPVVTVLGFWLGQLIVSTVIVEQVFNFHGIGQLLIQSASSKDVPLLLGLTLLTTIVIVVANLLVDLSYGYFNPRVRVGADAR
jgi:peptide/nickel transport system permease protein